MDDGMGQSLLILTGKLLAAWLLALLVGLAFYAVLPEGRGLAITRADTTLFISVRRLAVWLCLSAGGIAANLIFVRAAIRGIWLK